MLLSLYIIQSAVNSTHLRNIWKSHLSHLSKTNSRNLIKKILTPIGLFTEIVIDLGNTNCRSRWQYFIFFVSDLFTRDVVYIVLKQDDGNWTTGYYRPQTRPISLNFKSVKVVWFLEEIRALKSMGVRKCRTRKKMLRKCWEKVMGSQNTAFSP